MRRLLAIFMSLSLLLAATPVAPVSAFHVGQCDPLQIELYFVTVYDGSQQTGKKDSFCVSYTSGVRDDDTFDNSDGGESGKDVGDVNNMHDKVSSYALRNDSTVHTMCVKVYAHENQSGLIRSMWVGKEQSRHLEQGILNNDHADSIRVLFDIPKEDC